MASKNSHLSKWYYGSAFDVYFRLTGDFPAKNKIVGCKIINDAPTHHMWGSIGNALLYIFVSFEKFDSD